MSRLDDLQLLEARLGPDEAGALLGSLVHYASHEDGAAQLGAFFTALLDTEAQAVTHADQWGAAGDARGASLVTIYRDLSARVRPMHDLLPADVGAAIAEVEPRAIRAAYYWWLCAWRQSPDDLVYGAALLHGCYQGAFLGLAVRVRRMLPVLFLQHEGREDTFLALRRLGLGGPARLALSGVSDPGTQHVWNSLMRRVLKSGRRRRRVWMGDESDHADVAAAAIAKNLPQFPTLLDTTPQAFMASTVGDYLDGWRAILQHTHRRRRGDPEAKANEGAAWRARFYELRMYPLASDEEIGTPPIEPTWQALDAERLLDSVDAERRLEAIERIASNFTGRTREVYELKLDGLNGVQIAATLGVTPPAVAYHLRKIEAALKPFLSA